MSILNDAGESKKARYGGGSITKLPSGTWMLKWYGPAGLGGKRRRITETFRGNKKGAEKALRQRLTNVDDGKHVDMSKETTSHLMGQFMKGHVAKKCTLRTAQGYRGYIERYIDPTIGSIPYQGITGDRIDDVYEALMARGLSNTTVVQLHRIIHKAFAWAIKRKLIGLEPRRRRNATKEAPASGQGLGRSDHPQVLGSFRRNPVRIPI